MSEPCTLHNRVERIDSDSRDLAVEIAKLTSSIDRLDDRIDRTDQALEKLVELAGNWQNMAHQMARVETLLLAGQEINKKMESRIDAINNRVSNLEGTVKLIIRSIKWIVAAIGALLLQFSDRIYTWITHG
jgi:methyl-accepting chemotaxis protein